MDTHGQPRETKLMKLSLHCAPMCLIGALLAGCAWVPQKVTLAPNVQVPSSSVGNGATVIVKVLDTRPSLQIGYRGLDAKGAEITIEQELAPILQRKII